MIRPDWETRYARVVVVSDCLAVAVATSAGTLLGDRVTHVGNGPLSYMVAPVVVAVILASAFLLRAWEPSVLGQGSAEYQRVIRAHAWSAVAVGLVALSLQFDFARPWVFLHIPVACLLALMGRWTLRKALHRRRFAGECMHNVLAVAAPDAVADLVARARRDRSHGWVVTGACTPTGMGPDGSDHILGVPVLGDLDSVASIVRSGQHRVVSVSQAPGWAPSRLHQLAWDIEEVGAELVVDPRLMEVAGPRLHVTPVDGMPMLRLTRPTLNGTGRLVKTLVDRSGALALLTLLAPFMIVMAVAIRFGGGPVLYRQTRVGRDGTCFKMIKFRSMVVDADKIRPDVNDGSGPLYKLRRDPRVTRIGSWMRRYSVDELPQLFNVLVGTMSLVGPRPPLPDEVARYTRDAHRKFLVKPGLTGLWQVSGRSDLSWEESVRLDLRYVENWSLTQDALILWKTLGAVTRSSGAY